MWSFVPHVVLGPLTAFEGQDTSTRMVTAAAAVGSLSGFLFPLPFVHHFVDTR